MQSYQPPQGGAPNSFAAPQQQQQQQGGNAAPPQQVQGMPVGMPGQPGAQGMQGGMPQGAQQGMQGGMGGGPQQFSMGFGQGNQQGGYGGNHGGHQGGFGGGGGGGGFGNHQNNGGGGFGRGGFGGGHHGGGGFGGGHHGGGGGFGGGGHHSGGGFGGGGGGGYGGHQGGGGGGYGGGYGGGGGGGGFGGQGGGQFSSGPAYTREERPEEKIFDDHAPGLDFEKYESIEINVRPNDVTPIELFTDVELHKLLAENVKRCGYTKPTPVQKHGLPIVMNGKDLMACAQTGSGKTAAYLLPALDYTLKNSAIPTPCRCATPKTLILSPTRELSIQIYDEARKFTFRTGLRCVVVYGGASAHSQSKELQRGCNMVVATPGRLVDMFQRGTVRFSAIQFLVLDEADRMLDMGFEPQIRQIVEQGDMPKAGERQTLLYSATFPREIQQLAREFLSNHYFLQVGRVGSTTENITQDVRWVEEHDKRDMLMQILGADPEKLSIVFVEKKKSADYIEQHLLQARLTAIAIHGDRSQREREDALRRFKSGVCKVLVATDVAARGLDLPNVSKVVQFDLPTNIDDYVHRIGRTGRAGKTGTAIAFFNDKNSNIVDEMVPLMEETKQTVPDFLRAMLRPKRGHNQGRGRGRGGYGRGRGRGNGGYNNRNNYNNNRGGGGGGGYGGGGGGY